MHVLALIAERPPPTAVTGDKRSAAFRAFAAACLVRLPIYRFDIFHFLILYRLKILKLDLAPINWCHNIFSIDVFLDF
jgi:hypothetical protein